MEPIEAVGIVALVVFGVGIVYTLAHVWLDRKEH